MFLRARGAALYRAGQFADAAAALREGMSVEPDSHDFFDWVFLALAESQLGHADAAGEAAAKARTAKPETSDAWSRAEVELLTAELEAAMKGRDK